jgi:hypothetical protein
VVDEPPRNIPDRRFNEAWFREFLRRELELIGVNASTDVSRERTRSNFSFTDGMNNQAMREALSFLLDIYKEHEAVEKAIQLAKDRVDRGKDLRKGFMGSVGEWGGRIATGAVGTAIGWYLLGKH